MKWVYGIGIVAAWYAMYYCHRYKVIDIRTQACFFVGVIAVVQLISLFGKIGKDKL